MDEKDMPVHSRIAHILRELCRLDIPGLKVPATQGIVDRLAAIADELREAEMAAPLNEDPILSPENQTQQALMRAASVKDGREAATWAVAAAVFSLRDTVERATTGTAVVDPGQLTPEEIESIRRGPSGYVPSPFTRTDMGFDQALADEARRTQDALNCAREIMNRDPASQAPLGGRVGSQPTDPAVTREQVGRAIVDNSEWCKRRTGACYAHTCTCLHQTDAVMKLLEGGE